MKDKSRKALKEIVTYGAIGTVLAIVIFGVIGL